MALLHNVRGASSQAVALILSCPMFGSSLANGSSGKGKDRPFHEHCDYLLELANHGVFHANQSLVYRRNLITTISDEVWDKLEDPDTQKWFHNFAQYSRKFRYY